MNGFQIVVLLSDALLGVLLLALGAGIVAATRREHLRRAWSAVFASRVAMASLVVLTAYVLVAVLDSFHFRPALETADAPTPGATRYSVEVLSLLDVALGTLRAGREQSYSAPLATHGFEKRMQVLADGRRERVQPRLLFGGAHLADPAQGRATDIAFRVLGGVFGGVRAWTVLVLLIGWLAAGPAGAGTLGTLKGVRRGGSEVPARPYIPVGVCPRGIGMADPVKGLNRQKPVGREQDDDGRYPGARGVTHDAADLVDVDPGRFFVVSRWPDAHVIQVGVCPAARQPTRLAARQAAAQQGRRRRQPGACRRSALGGLGPACPCLLYTSDAADERSSVDLGGRRIIKKKKRSCRRRYHLQKTCEHHHYSSH